MKNMIQSYRRDPAGELEYFHGIHRNAWILAEEPDSDELDKLSKELGVARDLLQDARDPHEVSRIQEEEGVIYVFVRMPENDGERMRTTPVLFALGEDFLLSIWSTQPTFMEHYLGGKVNFSTDHRSQLLLKVWSDVIGTYQSAITELGRLVRASMGNVTRVENQDVLQLVTHEGTLNDFLAALLPMHAQLGSLVSGKYIKTYAEDEDLYEDVLLQSGQVLETCKSVLKTTVNYRDAYSVIVNNNLNRVVKFLTAATVILAFPTAIFSFYGMNVALPIDHSRIAWQIIMSSTVLLTGLLIVIFSRRHWL